MVGGVFFRGKGGRETGPTRKRPPSLGAYILCIYIYDSACSNLSKVKHMVEPNVEYWFGMYRMYDVLGREGSEGPQGIIFTLTEFLRGNVRAYTNFILSTKYILYMIVVWSVVMVLVV